MAKPKIDKTGRFPDLDMKEISPQEAERRMAELSEAEELRGGDEDVLSVLKEIRDLLSDLGTLG